MDRMIAKPAPKPPFVRRIFALAAGGILYLAQAGALMPLTYGALSAWRDLISQRPFGALLLLLLFGVFVEAGRWLGLTMLSDNEQRLSAMQAVMFGAGFALAELLRAALVASRFSAVAGIPLQALPLNPAGPIAATAGTLTFEVGLSLLAGAGVVRRWAPLFPSLAVSHGLLNVVLAELLAGGNDLSAQLGALTVAMAAGLLGFRAWPGFSAQDSAIALAPEQTGDSAEVVVENLRCTYNGESGVANVPQLGPLSFGVRPGKLLALLGPNGAGKTTTLRALAGLLKPVSGRISVFGIDISQADRRGIGALVGLASEEPGLYPRMRVRRYLEFFANLYHLPRQDRERRVAELLQLLGLGQRQEVRIGTLSKGERQKLALARTLLHEPRLLLLDEPTAALDPKVARSVRQLAGALKAGTCAIVIATHNLDEAQSLADELLVLREGEIVRRVYKGEKGKNGAAAARFEVRLAPGGCDGAAIAEKVARCLSLEDVVIAPGLGPGELVLSFSTATPMTTNPAVLNALLGMGLKPYALTPCGLSVEQVYSSEDDATAPDGRASERGDADYARGEIGGRKERGG
jgi:ABC-2 type transport system ATP-binding protein